MSTLQCAMDGKPVALHVFAQDGAWHWGISVPRGRGYGFQIVAYNERGFASESDAMSDGGLVMNRIAAMSGDAIGTPLQSVAEIRRRYMRERLRRAMARLATCDEADTEQAERWATAWGALIGEQHFNRQLWARRRNTGPVA